MTPIKDIQLYKENNKYYLSVLVEYEDERGIYEISIPKIEFPVGQNCIIEKTTENRNYKPCTTVSLDFGLGELYAEPFDDSGHYYTINCVEEKVHKMTLADIEKELGYKIELKEN